ncbi:MAG: PriCT-2 domain-containing protein [Limnohabitans sp.]
MLRQLRIQLGVDPSLLATNACISLSQLYELEDGGDARFYSASLRRQAGRRVARLLGADWDRMPKEDSRNAIHASNVVPLQRPHVHAVQAVPFSERIAHAMPLAQAAHKQSRRTQIGATLARTQSSDTPTVSMGLTAPASETIYMASSQLQVSAPMEAPVENTDAWPTWLALLMVIVVGIGAGYAFAVYSPYPKALARSRCVVEHPDFKAVADLRAALWLLDANDRDTWIKVGYALWTASEPGAKLWFEWSQRSPKFDARDARRTWNSFSNSESHWRAVFRYAQDAADAWVNRFQKKGI